MQLRTVFARNVRMLREAAKLSQEDLAAAAQIDRTYVSALERAKYSASLDTVERIARALSVPPERLIASD